MQAPGISTAPVAIGRPIDEAFYGLQLGEDRATEKAGTNRFLVSYESVAARTQ